jgi:anti-anti-sigma regulatory factor
MCLRHALDHPAEPATQVIIDLRDLTAINSRALALLTTVTADCPAHAQGLTLLLGGGSDHAAIADALRCAGLGDQIVIASRSPAPASESPHGIRRERVLVHDDRVTWGSYGARVCEVALRLRHVLVSHPRGHRSDMAGDHSEDEVRQRLYGQHHTTSGRLTGDG